MNVGGVEWPYHWALDESGEHLLGMLQRYGPAGLAVNTDAVDPQTMESGGYMEMIEGAKGQYGILDYENWVIMHTCIASGFIPFREHTADEMAEVAFEENIFKLFENAKKVSDDQAALARDMITGEIIGTYPGSVYTVSAARLEGETQLVNVVPAEGPEETKTAERPNGQGGIVWIEITSLVNNPNPTPLAEALLSHARGRLQGGCQGTGHTESGGADGRSGEVLSQFSQDELEAVHWGEEGSWLASLVDRCIDFDINPDYDAMHSTPRRSARAAPDPYKTERAVRRPLRRSCIPGA